MARPRAPVEEPEGLVYRPDFLTADEERALLAEIDQVEFDEVRMRGQVARRTARHYGYDYDYEQYGRVTPGEPIPEWLLPLRERCGELARVAADDLVEALVQRYPEGAQIGWHRDAPMFGTVVGVSLLGAARMRFRRGSTGNWETLELALEPRSGYVLAGEARTRWQHHVPPQKAPRYSVTFRTLRTPR